MCCTHDEPKRRESQRSRPRGATCVYHVTAKCDKTTTPRRKKPKGQKECSNNIRRPLCPVARNGLLRTCTQHTLHTSLLHLFLKVPVHINKISERLNLNQVQREREAKKKHFVPPTCSTYTLLLHSLFSSYAAYESERVSPFFQKHSLSNTQQPRFLEIRDSEYIEY